MNLRLVLWNGRRPPQSLKVFPATLSDEEKHHSSLALRMLGHTANYTFSHTHRYVKAQRRSGRLSSNWGPEKVGPGTTTLAIVLNGRISGRQGSVAGLYFEAGIASSHFHPTVPTKARSSVSLTGPWAAAGCWGAVCQAEHAIQTPATLSSASCYQ